ncbi:hypothetical protein SEA_RANA_23 [Streptomyces phage Rana]|uniref:DUF7298 domain-containing protein n=1 Tax=Streptomyces phage Lorelei TaxID=1873996 RepID=A0A1C9LWH8_9CAUD|nr:hypothetical protein KGH01_gp23 [Streptomyces phage Lorelei]AOQ26922.1 hypothetical protein SEA_LORELEI_23 [Streptomyces phage Lorelei]AWN07241.1 hypothetical protein SEA_RANA_23 [Streptomyces phage Rana]AWN07317.1 hypothetical protein SEA_NABI_23 [Streptomyces phage Nabi]
MGLNIWPPQISANIARGIVYHQAITANTAYIGDTETIVYPHTFQAAQGRTYKFTYNLLVVDADGVGDTTPPGAKNAAHLYGRWASGATVTSSSTVVAQKYHTIFSDSSDRDSGTMLVGYVVNPPAGQVTVGLGLRVRIASGTNGMTRILPGGGSYFAVEDVGSALA